MIRWWRRRRAPIPDPAPRPRPPAVRPAEFGPLLQPLEVVERVRTAIFRDQMKALAGRFAQRAEDFQDEFVERWGLHWTYDYVAWLTA